jgi:hypothetical protein
MYQHLRLWELQQFDKSIPDSLDISIDLVNALATQRCSMLLVPINQPPCRHGANLRSVPPIASAAAELRRWDEVVPGGWRVSTAPLASHLSPALERVPSLNLALYGRRTECEPYASIPPRLLATRPTARRFHSRQAALRELRHQLQTASLATP